VRMGSLAGLSWEEMQDGLALKRVKQNHGDKIEF